VRVGHTVIRVRDGVTLTVIDLVTHVVGVIESVPDVDTLQVGNEDAGIVARFEGLFVRVTVIVFVRVFVTDPLRERVVVIVRVGDIVIERVTVILVEIVRVGLIVGHTVIRLRDGVTLTVRDLLTHVVGVIDRVPLAHLVSVGKDDIETVEYVEGLRVILTE
jgi:hypothetical protein